MSPAATATDSSLTTLHLNFTRHGYLSGPNQGLRLGWSIVLSLAVRMLIYISILVVLVIVVALLFKYLGQAWNGDEIVERTTTTETSHLMPPSKAISFTYGTCDQEDLESGGKCSGNSSDELYDTKICIICYDEQRNCFFVPCGHCATCHVCAKRIVDEDSKACPVCRRFIHRVKKLFTPQNQNSAEISRQKKKIISLE